jgi:glycosyltransferase involved in cell wall biosynthesis
MPAERPVAAERPKLDISAVVPCYNEAESVDLAYERITRELERYGDVEVIFVDDGSTDATLERVRALAAADPRVKYLSFTRNFGQEAAFSAGFKYVAKPWTVQFDADLQWPPEEVHKLLARTAEGYDVVFGIRERRRDPWFRRLGAAASQWVARAWLGIEVPMGASAFRVVRTSVAKKIVALRLDTPYFIATVPRVGARYTSVPIVHHPRLHGVSKWSVRKLAVHALELLFGFSLRPIALAYLFSVAAVLLGLATAVLDLAGRLDAGGIARAGLAVQVLTLVALALVARYLVRLVKGQGRGPQFYVREANIPVQPEDDLYEHEHEPAAAPAVQRGLAS